MVTSLQTVLSTTHNDDVNHDFLRQLASLKNRNVVNCFDLVFIDHDKKKYLTDLKLLRELNLIRKGSVIVADNILSFGEPLTEYTDYVRKISSESKLYQSFVEYSVVDRDGRQYGCMPDWETGCGMPEDRYLDGVEVSVL